MLKNAPMFKNIGKKREVIPEYRGRGGAFRRTLHISRRQLLLAYSALALL